MLTKIPWYIVWVMTAPSGASRMRCGKKSMYTGRYTIAETTDTTAAAWSGVNPDCPAERIATVKLAQQMAAAKNNKSPRQLPLAKSVKPVPAKMKMPTGISINPSLRTPAIFSCRKNMANSAAHSGIVPGIKAPACAAGANCKPLDAIRTYGTPAPQTITNHFFMPIWPMPKPCWYTTGASNNAAQANRSAVIS